MAGYRNLMELLLEEQYDKIADGFGYCTCPRCRDDVIALALNRVPPKYVVTDKGGLYVKAAYLLHNQQVTDLTTALTLSAQAVGKAPRHELP